MTRPRLAVIGAGTMGGGIALAGLRSGLDIAVYDLRSDAAERVVDRLRADLRDTATYPDGAGTVTVVDRAADAVAGADVVIECVPEMLPVKIETLTEVRRHAAPESLLATNTSTMSITVLAELSGCDDRLLGLHFFNPAERMRLVEVVRAPHTRPDVVSRGESFARRLGKEPVSILDSPGFVTSRLGLVLGNEAMLVLESGIASASAIDTAMRLGYNHPMGPLELADLVGLDARLNNLRALHEARQEERFRPPQILVNLVAANRLGRKTGSGFYNYDADRRRTGEAPLPGADGATGAAP